MTTAAIPATPARIRAVPAATRRAGLPGTLRSELTKILSVRSTYWTLLAQVVASIGWAVINCAGIVSHGIGPGFNAAQASLTGQVALGELIIVVLGALVITSEYSTGMIRTSLAVMPRRGVLYAAKAMVFAAVTLSISLVASFVDFFVGQAILSSKHYNTTLGAPGVLRAVLLSAAIMAVFGLLAYGAGAIIRHSAAGDHLDPRGDLPDPCAGRSAAEQLVCGRGPVAARRPGTDAHRQLLAIRLQPPVLRLGEFAVFSGYAAVLLALGAGLFIRRDA